MAELLRPEESDNPELEPLEDSPEDNIQFIDRLLTEKELAEIINKHAQNKEPSKAKWYVDKILSLRNLNIAGEEDYDINVPGLEDETPDSQVTDSLDAVITDTNEAV